ncbi:metallophosphoesterase [Virgibacillus profundi]|uniref:Metallophosphoesterase n=1 Tax=Virgibacillus profundi TaxID=2024555 RepID=A0A2A2IGB8_9BACI|nr:metallophosphoesterase [Virgibacillus profundi]PAV31041.1 metallophosphoesterase [Virgibacillus profundi]PXY55227.1 metallophosphoesterase [Virgibacillus profundi]
MTYLIITLLLIAFGILIYKAYTNTKDIQINKIKIDSKQTIDNSSISILHLSDLHLENISISPEELALKVQNEKPDIIALTGDFLDRKRTIPKLIPYLKVLQEVQPKHGIYAVFGNHDYVLKDKDFAKLKDLLLQFDCHVLQNSSETITIKNQVINIIGIDDYSTNRSDISLAYKQVIPGMNIVLTHDPTIVLEMENYAFDYLLAGHFHGGQICYPKAYHLAKMGKLARKNIIKGLHMHNSSPFYISEGLGQTGFNIRVGSRPEITLHDVAISHKSA